MPSPSDLWDWIRGRKTVVPRFAEVPMDQVLIPVPGKAARPNHDYFAVVVDELFLANSRQWHQEFDPMVLAISEFVYGSSRVTLPFVVGPKLLGDRASAVPQGMLFYKGTRVAGVHPFRGGRVVLTVVLCQVRRRDYSKELLKLVESIANTVPFGADLTTYARFSGSLLDGVAALFAVGETMPLVGVRLEFDHDLGSPIRPAYFVLIDGPEDRFARPQLWVNDGNLMIGNNKDQLKPMREASYVLFSTRVAAELSEVQTLPFHSTAASVIALAASSDDEDWRRAKAELVVLFRQLIASPDLTREQAGGYHASIVQQAKDARERAKAIGTLATDSRPRVQDELRSVTALLDLP